MSEFVAGPEGGTEKPESVKDTPEPQETTCFGLVKRKPRKPRANNEVPAEYISVPLVVGFNGYLLYAFCYLAVWHRVRPRNEGAAIAILVLFCWLNAELYVSWLAVHLWGPGKVTSKEYSEGTPSEHAFPCDEDGYSFYCSDCQSIKPSRAHHSGVTESCVPAMDHICPWLASVIGQGNVKFFIQYVWAATMSLILVLVTLLIYQHDGVPHINGNIIALYASTGLALMFTGSLLIQHTAYIGLGHTLLESMAWRKGRLPHFNIPTADGSRVVVHPTKPEVSLPHHSPYSKGIWRNITDVMGPVWMWPLPIRPPIREPLISRRFVDRMRVKAAEENPSETTSVKSAPETLAEKVADSCLARHCCFE